MTDRIWLKSYLAGVAADIDVAQYGSLVAVAAILRAALVLMNINPLLKDSGAKATIILENFAATLEKCLAATPVPMA